MKIVVTYDNGNVFQYFGYTEQFVIYEVENPEIISEKLLYTNGSCH